MAIHLASIKEILRQEMKCQDYGAIIISRNKVTHR